MRLRSRWKPGWMRTQACPQTGGSLAPAATQSTELERPDQFAAAVLNTRRIGFCMHVEKAGNTGFVCVPDFLRSGEDDRIVTLAAPDRRDDADHECPATAQTVRLIRQVSSTGKVGVPMSKLIDPLAFPRSEFGDLYHQRWRIEEAFKRLKHRLNLEHASGLSQQAALHDFGAKSSAIT